MKRPSAIAAGLALAAGLTLPVLAMPVAHAATCIPTPVSRDNRVLTAEVFDQSVPAGSTLDGQGCDIVDYVSNGGSVSVSGEVTNGTYFGVYVDNHGTATFDGADVHNVGDTPKDGAQHGVDIYFADGSQGSIVNSSIYDYQKGGIVISGGNTHVSDVTGNTVTGLGNVDFIAQNGIQISDGAQVGTLTNNTVTGNHYTQGAAKGYVSTGILIFGAPLPSSAKNVGGVSSTNTVNHNQSNVTYIK